MLNLCVDGHEFKNPESDMAGDGQFPPFQIFDIDAQTYLPGEYRTRSAAEKAMLNIKLKQFPKLEKDVQIEVPSPRNGRPGYRWVQGWIVRYAEHRTSIPMRLQEARNEYARAVREARGV